MFQKLHINTAQLLLWPEFMGNSNCCSPSAIKAGLRKDFSREKSNRTFAS